MGWHFLSILDGLAEWDCLEAPYQGRGPWGLEKDGPWLSDIPRPQLLPHMAANALRLHWLVDQEA